MLDKCPSGTMVIKMFDSASETVMNRNNLLNFSSMLLSRLFILQSADLKCYGGM